VFGEGSTFLFTINGKYVGENCDAAASMKMVQPSLATAA
jgi:hypothetical protein